MEINKLKHSIGGRKKGELGVSSNILETVVKPNLRQTREAEGQLIQPESKQ